MEFATQSEYILFYIGSISSGLFLLKIILMFIGGDFEGTSDFESDAGDSDGDFGVFSINAIICFFMGFGWFSLASIKDWGISFYPSLTIGLTAGVLCSLLFSAALGFAKKLNHESPPTSLKKGDVGQVYSKIPALGIGKITVDNRIVKATSDKEIASFTRIQVLEDITINTNAVAKVTTL